MSKPHIVGADVARLLDDLPDSDRDRSNPSSDDSDACVAALRRWFERALRLRNAPMAEVELDALVHLAETRRTELALACLLLEGSAHVSRREDGEFMWSRAPRGAP